MQRTALRAAADAERWASRRGVTSRSDGHSARSEIIDKENAMPKYVIEREIPGAGKLSPQELKSISQKSCGVLSKLGPQIQWLQS
jgi:hypothetical protein